MHRGYNRWITIGFYLSLIIIISVRFVGPYVSEFFPGGATLADILYNISLSYVVSWIFYFVVVYLPDRQNKKNVFSHASYLTERMLSKWSQLFSTMEQTSGVRLGGAPTIDDFKNLCAKINPHENAPVVGGFSKDPNTGEVIIHNLKWGRFIFLHLSSVKSKSDEILNLMPYVETELISRIGKMIDSDFLDMALEFFNEGFYNNAQNQDITFVAKEMHQFYYFANEVNDYLAKNKMA